MQFKEAPEKPLGSYYVRIFGNEIRYDDFHEPNTAMLKQKFDYLAWLTKMLDGYNWDVTKSINFLNAELQVPTAIGMPLLLTLDGTATVDLKVKAKMDIKKQLTSVDLMGEFQPR